MKNEKVVVAMSGGVDSSVSALILKQMGYDVVGLHMKESNAEQESKDENDLRALCSKLEIPLYIEEYTCQMQRVKDYFLDSYKQGKTPNPCVMCNREVKFTPFIEFADKIGAKYFATGHYAQTEVKDGVTYLKKGADSLKDQSYFLNRLTQEQVSRAIFPVGTMKKNDLRKLAEAYNLGVAHKKDSFDVCFVGSQKFKDYMKTMCPERKGDIVDIETGKVVGRHDGILKYTTGQRRGVGVGGQKDAVGRWFVVDKDIKNNVLYVSTNEEKFLFSKRIICKDFNWISGAPESRELRCKAKVRYRQDDQSCTLKITHDGVEFIFDEPQRAVAKGQFAVAYDGDICLGGGEITDILRN